MSFIRQITLVIDGNPVDGLRIAVGSTVKWNLTCMDPNDIATPLDLTASAIIMGLVALDSQGRPIYPAIIQHQATITSAVDGECFVEWTSGDTVPDGNPLSSGLYGLDVWIEDVNGNREQDLGFSIVSLTPAGVLPNTEITPLPSQLPLAQGPQGPAGTPAIKGKADFVASSYEVITVAAQPSADMDIQLTLKDADSFVSLQWEQISTTQFGIRASGTFTGKVCYAVLA